MNSALDMFEVQYNTLIRVGFCFGLTHLVIISGKGWDRVLSKPSPEHTPSPEMLRLFCSAVRGSNSTKNHHNNSLVKDFRLRAGFLLRFWRLGLGF